MTETRSGLRGRLPTILAEVVSVIFAVLVALAADEWWEEREALADAERMTEAIAQEIRGNRGELLDAGGMADADSLLAALDSAVATFQAGDEPDGLSIDWDVALLSSAAWNAAQVSGATQHMELDLLIDLAQVYEFQRLYGETQDELVSIISDMPAGIETAPVQTLLTLRSRFQIATRLSSTLGSVYACTLVGIEGPDSADADGCPSDDEIEGEGEPGD